jgi:hypothetical protein
MKRQEHIEAAKQEAIRLGAILEIVGRNGHYIGVIYFNNKQRKVTFSSTPNGMCCRSVETYVRRIVRELA